MASRLLSPFTPAVLRQDSHAWVCTATSTFWGHACRLTHIKLHFPLRKP